VSDHPYAALTPDVVLDAVESRGLRCDGRILALNSYENRVYQVGLEDAPPLVGKFYRPGRWDRATLVEEHAFAAELAAAEIPVVAAMDWDGDSLFEHAGFYCALYPRRGGRRPDLERSDDLRWTGRFLGRIHAVGASRRFEHRPRIDAQRLGHEPRAFVLAGDFLPDYLRAAYESVSAELLAGVDARLDALPARALRLHGDCHHSNILWTDDGPHFVDLDDCCTGPAIQDLWMLLSGEREEQTRQLAALLEGYRDFADFDPLELGLVEALRSLRILHYAAWLARRWDDPAFPQAFPWFAGPRYWEEHVLALREQLAALQEPALAP
jgi:Ser/Thr protein kinase RdoA (MazF antagonist)